MTTAPPASSSAAAADQNPSRPPGADPAEVPPTSPLTSAALLQGKDVVHIEHNGAVYRLQATRQGKLILTK